MSWKTHINFIAGKITRSIGILNRLKHFLPLDIRKIMYNSLTLSHINYGILLWGFNSNRIIKLQKKAIRLLNLSKYNAHTEPIFKSLNTLKLNDIFCLNQLKFYYKLIHNKLPDYFDQFRLKENRQFHHHNTRNANYIRSLKVQHVLAKKCIRYNLTNLFNNTSTYIKEKLYTHSLTVLSTYVNKT